MLKILTKVSFLFFITFLYSCGESKTTAKSEEQIKPMLEKGTCMVCHQVDRKLIGPSFRDIAKKNYSEDRIVELIKNPEPQNWPDYTLPMAPITHISDENLKEIALWINSLN
ncbi:MAG: cytochrome C [Reichenbachiella sp.]